MSSFVTKRELRCSGISWILSQMLLAIAFFLFAIDYDAYSVKNEEDVLSLHNILSSSKYRTEVEIAVTCIWCSFPFLFISSYGLINWFTSIVDSSAARMFIYVADRAWIIYIAIICVILPAISLVMVSYDWDFYESTTDGQVPTGYYIQLNLLLLLLEIIDCVSVADSVFLLFMLIVLLMLIYGANKGNKKFQQFMEIFQPRVCSRKFLYFSRVIALCCFSSLFCAFLFVLFEFAESGFFSLAGYAKIMVIMSFIAKIWIGVRTIYMSTDERYDAIKKIFDKDQDENASILSNVTPKNYQMQQIETDATGKIDNK